MTELLDPQEVTRRTLISAAKIVSCDGVFLIVHADNDYLLVSMPGPYEAVSVQGLVAARAGLMHRRPQIS